MQPTTVPQDLSALRREAAAALRALNDAFVAHEADAQLLEDVAAQARRAAALLAQGERRDREAVLAAHVARIFSGARPEPREDAGDPMADRAVGGPHNPISTELDFSFEDGEVVVRTVLGTAYEGAPGRAHGGMVAAVFDDITGFVLPSLGTAAYTGQLTVRYHHPVPVEQPLEWRSRLDRRDGRKVWVTADCRAAGELVASAEALFITVDTSRFGTRPA